MCVHSTKKGVKGGREMDKIESHYHVLRLGISKTLSGENQFI